MKHEWVRAEGKPLDWAGAQCANCGMVATNCEIASRLYNDACPKEKRGVIAGSR